MARGVIRVGDNNASVTADISGLLNAIDQVRAGAARSFIARAEKTVDPVVDDAADSWLVRTGASKKGLEARTVVDVNKSTINVGAYNDVPHAWYVRYSVRTTESLEREAAAWAARGGSASARRSIYDFRLKALQQVHGVGAPDAKVAGRQLWSILVRRPLKQQQKELLNDIRDDVATLAKEA